MGQARRLGALGAAERQADAVRHDLQPARARRGDAVGQPARADRLGDDLDEAEPVGARERAVDLRAPAGAAAEPCDDRRRAAHDPPPPQPPPPQPPPPPPPPSDPPEPQLEPQLRAAAAAGAAAAVAGVPAAAAARPRAARRAPRRRRARRATARRRRTAPPPSRSRRSTGCAAAPSAPLRWRLRISRPRFVAGGRRRASATVPHDDHDDDPHEHQRRPRRWRSPAAMRAMPSATSSPPASQAQPSERRAGLVEQADARQVLAQPAHLVAVGDLGAQLARGDAGLVAHGVEHRALEPVGAGRQRAADLQRRVVGAALQQPVVVQLRRRRGDRQLRAAAEHRELVGVQLGQRVVATDPCGVRIAACQHGRDRGDDAQADVDLEEQRAADAPGCRDGVHGHSLHLSK